MQRIIPIVFPFFLLSLHPVGTNAQNADAPQTDANDESGRAEQEIHMVVGDQHVLDAHDIASFSESTRGVIEVRIPRSGDKMILTAVSPGRTSLLLIDKQGAQHTVAVRVFARNPKAIVAEVKQLLKDRGQLEYLVVGARVFIDGVVSSKGDLLRIQNVCKLYDGQLQSLVQVGHAVTKRPNIQVTLTFLETDQSDDWQAGIQWPSSLGASGTLNFDVDLFTGAGSLTYQIADQLMPSLHAAASKGIVKINKQAYLTTTSGNEATYSSGGEINVVTQTSLNSTLSTIFYGTKLTVVPVLDEATGRIDVTVTAEVSEIQDVGQAVPGRTLAQVSTLVHLELGQSIILSGLDSNVRSLNKSGIPLLSRIPILGALFGVHRGRKHNVRGLIAITPVVVDNVDVTARRALDEALREFSRPLW